MLYNQPLTDEAIRWRDERDQLRTEIKRLQAQLDHPILDIIKQRDDLLEENNKLSTEIEELQAKFYNYDYNESES